MRGQCSWKGGSENELEFTLGTVKLGPFTFGKGEVEAKTYSFFFGTGGKVRRGEQTDGGRVESEAQVITTCFGEGSSCSSGTPYLVCVLEVEIFFSYHAG